MSPLTSFFITVFSWGTLGVQAVSVVLIIVIAVLLLQPKDKTSKNIKKLISDNYVLIILVLSALATVGSLALSEIVNFVPCKLCWYQRVFMYPQAIVAFIAIITNEKNIRKYILPLSIIGILIAAYHILLQVFPNAFQCNDEVAKCSAVQFAQFGYITIPVMAFSFFLLIILVSLFTFELKKKKQ